MSNKLRVGIVGLKMGKAHIKGFQEHPQVEVVAVSDINETLLHEVKDQFNIKSSYSDYMEMLEKENLDIVSVVTPNILHKPITINALEAGCHVLCEKPMAMNAEEANEMMQVAKKCNKNIMINFSYRFTPQAWMLKKQAEQGVFGDFYFGRTVWHRRRGMPGFGGWFGQKKLSGGGPLIDLGVHRIDLALWLMGYPEPDYIMGSTYNHIACEEAKKQGKEFDVEDLAGAMIKFKNGATLMIEASWAANIKEREHMKTRLLGTKGGLVQYNVNEGYEYESEIFYEQNGAHFDSRLHKNIPIKGKPATAMYHFAQSLLDDTPYVATAQEGLTVMKILDAIYESAEKGQPIHITDA